MSALPSSLPESTNSAPLRRLDLDHQDSSRWQTDFINGLLVVTDPGGDWKQHDTGTSDTDRMLGQGKVFMYRFVC